MRTMTREQLRAHALARGAEAVIDGRGFNASRSTFKPEKINKPEPAAAAAPPTPPPAAPPAPAAAPAAPAPRMYSQDEMDTRLAAMSDDFTKQLDAVLELVRSREGAEKDDLVATDFVPQYDAEGKLTLVGVKYQRIQ